MIYNVKENADKKLLMTVYVRKGGGRYVLFSAMR